MPGALLQLNSTNVSNNYLVNNPQIRFYRKVMSTYNNFAKILYYLDPIYIANKEQKQLFSVNIPKHGDLIKELYVSIKIPCVHISNSNATSCDTGWLDNLPARIIKRISFSIGCDEIQSFNSEYLYTHRELFQNYEIQAIYNHLSSSFDVYSDALPNIELLIPIPVWFFNEPFPICCLNESDLCISLELESLEHLTTELFEPADYNYNADIQVEFLVNYIFLEAEESRRYYASSHHYLIEQYNLQIIEHVETQLTTNDETDFSRVNIIYETRGCTKDIIILPRKMYTTVKTAAQRKLNFTNLDNIYTFPYINNEIIKNMEIKFNKQIRLDRKTSEHFRYLEAFKNYTATAIENGVYLYSFSLKPHALHPSGQCNFRHINSVSISMDMVFDLVADEVEGYEVLLFNRFYNILTVQSGGIHLVF